MTQSEYPSVLLIYTGGTIGMIENPETGALEAFNFDQLQDNVPELKRFNCVIPGEHEVDLKMAAKVSGNKKCDLIPMKELLPLTGYIRGGCSPIGMKKHFPTYIHETCTAFSYIYISAGIRGLQIKIAADDLIKETKAEICSLFTE